MPQERKQTGRRNGYVEAHAILYYMYLYLLLLIVFVVLPNIVLLYFNRKNIHVKTLLLSLVLLFVIAVIWDYLSVRWGLWSFNDSEIIGSVFGLPVEEYLFFVFVPLLAINVYLLFEKKVRKKL